MFVFSGGHIPQYINHVYNDLYKYNEAQNHFDYIMCSDL